MVKIIADPGSCHLGVKALAKQLIDVSKEAGADAVKFQLFKYTRLNISIAYKWFPELVKYANRKGIEIFASCFEQEAVNVLIENDIKTIKLAYSTVKDWRSYKWDLSKFDTVYASGDVMTDCWPEHDNLIKLYCIPEYPVKYYPSYTGLFNERFNGFSSHCLGWEFDKMAVLAGAKIIEKHIRLDIKECEDIPDGKFALKPLEFKAMVDHIREAERV